MKKCLHCNSEIPNRNIYCNNQCQKRYETSKKIELWEQGNNFLRSDGLLIPRWIRNYLLEESDFKCSQCGWSEMNMYSKTVPVEIDHIDGDAKNNTKDNLRVLCPNCHSLQKTYKNTGARKSSRNRKK